MHTIKTPAIRCVPFSRAVGKVCHSSL
jgi:hypothetical protein